MTRTIYLWYGIYHLPVGAKITDSRGTDYWRVGDDHLIDEYGHFVSHEAVELPVTVELDGIYRTRVFKKFGTRHWAVRNLGHNYYKTFRSHAAAIAEIDRMGFMR